MKFHRLICLALTGLLALGLCACAPEESGGVYVQRVSDLAPLGAIAPGDRFAGMVVSEHVAEVNRDQDKSIDELLVSVGDNVSEGDVLFRYDTEQLQLSLDKQKLEMEQLVATIDNCKKQIADLEKERSKAPSGDKLAYTVQIQSLQVDLKEAELNVASKQASIDQTAALLENAEVTAPVTGRIQSISEQGYDNYGNAQAYITILQAGAYRVKGTIGEQQLGGLTEGTRIRILSRTDESKVWLGAVAMIDYENPTQGNNNGMYIGGGTDEMTTTSRYPFYIQLDDTEGLILGQHVYLEVDLGETEVFDGVILPSAFLCFADDGSTYVWAEENGALTKKTVVLGDFVAQSDGFQILEGLSESDYIAFPDESVCAEGAPTTRDPLPVNEESGVA